MSRAAQLDCQHVRSCALVLTLILFQKGQGFFPPLPIAALLPRRWRWADSKESQLGCYGVTWLVLQQKNRLVFSLRLMLCLLNQSVAWDASSRPGYSCNTKGQRDFISTLVFVASHEARCRMAAFSIQQTRKPHQTGEPRGPSPSGGKTPAKPHIPLRPCAPMARSPGVQGVTPCYTVRVSCSPRRAAFSARRGRMKVERNSSTCWALRPV